MANQPPTRSRCPLMAKGPTTCSLPNEDEPLPVGIKAQTRRVMDNLKLVLSEIGRLGLEHVVSARVFLIDMREFESREQTSGAPKYLIRDNDRAFGAVVQARVRATGIRDRAAPNRSRVHRPRDRVQRRSPSADVLTLAQRAVVAVCRRGGCKPARVCGSAPADF
jgi:hypothetical protein